MNNNFVRSYQSEWIKKRRSFSAWLVLVGSFFVPFIMLLIFLAYPKQLLSVHASGHFWQLIFQKAWQLMSFMLLPMGIVLAVSLVTQLEFKNNNWKQLHSTPLSFSSIYFSKLAVLLTMLLQLFILFNIGIYLSVLFPALLNQHLPYPNHPINPLYFLEENFNYFLTCLPMLALQYLISLQFKNFLVPLGIGLALVAGGLIGISWKYNYLLPSCYTAVYFLQHNNKSPQHNLQLWSIGYFIFFTLTGYLLYINKKEKG